MMIASFFSFIIVGAIVLLYVVIGITLDDIKSIRRQRDMTRHPNARRWRHRPVVTILANDGGASVLVAVRREYRKVAIRNESHGAEGLVLTLPATTTLPPSSFRSTVQRFNAEPSLRTVDIMPAFDRIPSSVFALMMMHHAMLAAPLAAARSGYGVPSRPGLLIRMINTDAPAVSPRITAHTIFSILAHTIHLIGFAVALYAACVLLRPELLVIYLGGFIMWAILAIGRYPSASFSTKLFAVALLPVSGVYFAYRLTSAPFRSLRRLRPEMV